MRSAKANTARAAQQADAFAAGQRAAQVLVEALESSLSADGAKAAHAALRGFYSVGGGLHPSTRDALAYGLLGYLNWRDPPRAYVKPAPRLRLIPGGRADK